MSRHRHLLTTTGTPPPDPVIDHGLQFVVDGNGVGRAALLAQPDLATAIVSQNWQLSFTVRIDGPRTGYVFSRADGSIDEYCVYYATNYLHFFANGTNQGTIDLALSVATPPGPEVLQVEFTYDNLTLKAFLNGAPAGTLAVAGLVLAAGNDNTLALGLRNNTGGGPTDCSLFGVDLLDNANHKVAIGFEESAPPYANTGTAGGLLALGSPPPVPVQF